MIIYNITTQISWRINDAWIDWMKEEYIPAMLSTGLFAEYRWLKLMEVDEEEGPTYAIQYYFANTSGIRTYREQYQEKFQLMHRQQWGDNAYSFASLMEVIN